MNAVVFDLDNTLYPETEFVKSGMKAAACYLSARYGLEKARIFENMLHVLERDGRGKVFDKILRELGLYSPERVLVLVQIYRSHRPKIQLFEDVVPTLHRLREAMIKSGILTDGIVSVQKNKIDALGLDRLVDVILCTDELGRDYWKPSPVPFKVVLEHLNLSPTEASYVGDDISKDFAAPNSLGMLTIQIKRRSAKQQPKNDSVNAAPKHVVSALGDILPIIGV
jgi:putative hydrolase of the HAD superfamily